MTSRNLVGQPSPPAGSPGVPPGVRVPVGLLALIAVSLLFRPLPGVAKSDANVVLVQEHQPLCQILPQGHNPRVHWAAQELEHYVSQITGASLPIRDKAGLGVQILVGLREDFPSADRALLPAMPQGYDGYVVAILGGNTGAGRVLIAGNNLRGTIYGVYDVLERAGCRWFYPAQDPEDPEVIRKAANLSLPVSSWAVASGLRYRICVAGGWLFEPDLALARQQADWAMKNRYNAMGWGCDAKSSLAAQYQKLRESGLLAELGRRGVELYGPGHCFDQFLRAEDHMSQHPEWFGLRGGKRVPQTFLGAQFCWSNVEARKQFIENAVAFIRHAPELHIFCLGPFDGGPACDCANCKAQGSSNLLLTLMNELLARLERSRPDVLVETLGGYAPVAEPPDRVKVNPALRIIWADWGRYMAFGYDDPRYGRRDNLERWRKSAPGGLNIFQYYSDNFAEPWVMAPFAVALEGDRRYLLGNKIDAVSVLMWPRGYWWNHGLNAWLAGRCLYDAGLSPYEQIRDYALHYFGEEAGPLLGRYYEQWARDVDLSYHLRAGATDQDRAALAAQRATLLEPALRAVRGEPVLERRANKVEKLHRLAEKLMETQRLHEEVQKLREAGQFSRAGQLLEQSSAYAGGVLAYLNELVRLNQGFLGPDEIPLFIKPTVNDWIAEEREALAKHQAASRPAPTNDANRPPPVPPQR